MTQSAQSGYDAVIVGAGPNGLAAAITLARAGRSVVIYEAEETVGGGARTKELTLPGFRHDVCSAIHPLGLGSPFFQSLALDIDWIHPPLPLAHPLPDGTAAVLYRSLSSTAQSLGADGRAWRRLLGPLIAGWEEMAPGLLGPLRPLWQARHPLTSLKMLRFGVTAIQPASELANRRFQGERARALFAGMSAHSMLPLERPMSAAFGLMLGTLGQVVGWPFPRGGSQAIADALAAYLRSLGGEIVTGVPVTSLAELPAARAVLCDVTPRQLLALAGERLPAGYRAALARYRYGP
ncbi:MAG: phytoene desaturase family protein, partial [Ktedonobacterales bacterium]